MINKIKQLLREGLIKEFFNPTIDNDIKERSNRYEGRNVIWYGAEGQMVVLHKSQIHGMWGNIYDNDKLEYIKDLIIDHPEKVEIECSYGIASVTTIQDIIEHQISVQEDSFQSDYDGHDKPYTTGDEVVDTYLGMEYVSEHDLLDCDDTDAMDKFADKNKTRLALGSASVEEFKQLYLSFNSDPSELDLEAFGNLIELENRLKHAIDNDEGDLNKLSVQLRDSHHRIFGAINAGETHICINIEKDTLETYRKYLTMVTTK